jgi:hypothetical protein
MSYENKTLKLFGKQKLQTSIIIEKSADFKITQNMRFVIIKVILKTDRTKNIFPKQIMRVYKTNMRTLNIKNKELMEKN